MPINVDGKPLVAYTPRLGKTLTDSEKLTRKTQFLLEGDNAQKLSKLIVDNETSNDNIIYVKGWTDNFKIQPYSAVALIKNARTDTLCMFYPLTFINESITSKEYYKEYGFELGVSTNEFGVHQEAFVAAQGLLPVRVNIRGRVSIQTTFDDEPYAASLSKNSLNRGLVLVPTADTGFFDIMTWDEFKDYCKLNFDSTADIPYGIFMGMKELEKPSESDEEDGGEEDGGEESGNKVYAYGYFSPSLIFHNIEVERGQFDIAFTDTNKVKIYNSVNSSNQYAGYATVSNNSVSAPVTELTIGSSAYIYLHLYNSSNDGFAPSAEIINKTEDFTAEPNEVWILLYIMTLNGDGSYQITPFIDLRNERIVVYGRWGF